MGGWGGFTVIIMQVSVQIGLNWNWPTGTELGNTLFKILYLALFCLHLGFPIQHGKLLVIKWKVTYIGTF